MRYKGLIGVMFLVFTILTFSNFVDAQPPLYHEFYGNITCNNDDTVKDGTTITAIVDGINVFSDTTSGGGYHIITEGRNGDLIEFNVESVNIVNQTFSWFTSTVLNIQTLDDSDCTTTNPPPTNGGGSSGGGSGGGGSSGGGSGGGGSSGGDSSTTNVDQPIEFGLELDRERIEVGTQLNVNVFLANPNQDSKNIELTYRIIDSQNQILFEDVEIASLVDNLDLVRGFDINNFPDGSYALEVALRINNQDFDTQSRDFVIVRQATSDLAIWVIVGLIALYGLGFVGFAVYRLVKRPRLPGLKQKSRAFRA